MKNAPCSIETWAYDMAEEKERKKIEDNTEIISFFFPYSYCNKNMNIIQIYYGRILCSNLGSYIWKQVLLEQESIIILNSKIIFC